MGSLSRNTADDLCKVLREYSSCDISDALQALGHSHGGFIVGPSLWSPERRIGTTRIVGRAYTVRYVPVSADTSGIQISGCAQHYVCTPALTTICLLTWSCAEECRTDIDGVPSGSVPFISAPHGTENAVYGGMMSKRARARGAVGTVVLGRVRDLEEHRELGYPVFANGVGTASPYGVVKVGEVNGDITVTGQGQHVLVRAGDYLIGDLNGVVCLPFDLAQQALELMEGDKVKNAKVAADLMGGVGFAEASHRHRRKR